MYKCIVAVCLLLTLLACQNDASTKNGGAVGVKEFTETFKTIELPYELADTNMVNLADTTTLEHSMYSSFIPDTVLLSQFTKPSAVTISPIGKFKNKEKETYLLAKAYTKSKRAIYLLVFNDTLGFSAGLPLLVSNKDAKVTTTVSIDKKFGISIYDQWKADNVDYYKRDTYAYNNVGTFTLVLSETNDFNQKQVTEVNPLDTFPQKNKLSGDYYKGKNNLLSIRDGKDEQNYRFYVYFKSDGDDECTGELRGEMQLTSPTTGVFSENGDPCKIDFTFDKNKVKVKEQGSCGNYRGIKCFFNDTFTRKKEASTKSKK